MNNNHVAVCLAVFVAWYFLAGPGWCGRQSSARMRHHRHHVGSHHPGISRANDDPILDSMDMARAGSSLEDISKTQVQYVI